MTNTLTAGNQYRVVIEKNVSMHTRDGVKLNADVYRPDADGQFPVLFMRTPYNKELTASREILLPEVFVSRGYVVVLQDTRGRATSEGVFNPLVYEAADTYDAVEWAAKLPGSDGQVGMAGQSYHGAVQYLGATLRPPHLKSISPISGPTGCFTNCIWRGGALELGWWLPYVVMMSADTLARQGLAETELPKLLSLFENPGAQPASPLRREEYARLPMAEWADRLEVAAPYLREQFEHSNNGPYWWWTDITRHATAVDVPGLHIGSWFDLFQPSVLSAFTSIREHGATERTRRSQRLVMGPWTHEHYAQPNPVVGEIDFGAEAALDVMGLQLEWFDHTLKGVPGDLDERPPVSIFVMGENRWREENEWPPARTVYTDVFLHSDGRAHDAGSGDGRLSLDGPADEPADTYLYDPNAPVPSCGGTTGVIPAGIYDQRDVESRPDVLVYTGEPLSSDLEVTGPVRVSLFAASTATDTDFTARLVDVRPDGRALNVADGIVRARFRDSSTHPTLLAPGEVYEYTIDLWSTSYVFRAGHRLRLDITSSDFPRYDRNPNSGNAWGTDSILHPARQTILHTARYPSRLVLPVIPPRPGTAPAIQAQGEK